MKLLSAIILSLISITSVTGEITDTMTLPTRQQRILARIEQHRLDGRENNIFLTLGTGMTAHDQALFRVKLEYSRQIKGNFFWGCAFTTNLHGHNMTNYDWNENGSSPYRNTVDQHIYKLDGMIFYRLRVIGGRLFFRIGTGLGAGYHRVRSIDDDYMRRDKVLPYFNLEGAWIIQVTKGFEMKFTPTFILAPSEFCISPVKLGAPTDITPWLSDIGISLAFGWRF